MKKLITLAFVFLMFTIPMVVLQRHKKEVLIPDALFQSHVLNYLYDVAGTKDFTITPLKGGMSGSGLYKADSNNKSYVIRMLGNNRSIESKEREATVQTIASEQGWGPQLYASDANEGWIIMEYIQPTPLTEKDRADDDLYRALGKRLQQIHTGPEFTSKRDMFKHTAEKLERLHKEDKIPQSIGYVALKSIIDSVQKNRSLVLAPTHRDLNPNNIIFSHHQPYIIDFEDAAQDDPFYDLGTVGIFYIFNPHHEKLFLGAYFNRTPTQQEYAYYQVGKQAALLQYGFNFLSFAPQDVIKNVSVVAKPFKQLLQDFNNGIININDPADQLKLAVSLLQEAINQVK